MHPFEAAACRPLPSSLPSPNIDLSDITASCRWKMLSTVCIRPAETTLKSCGNPGGIRVRSRKSEREGRRVGRADLRKQIFNPFFAGLLLSRFKIVRVKKKGRKNGRTIHVYKLSRQRYCVYGNKILFDVAI